MSWRVVFTRQAQKDAKKLSSAGLQEKAKKLIEILRDNPYQVPPPYEKLLGDLAGAYSRRINIQHRLVYQALNDEKVVKVLYLYHNLQVIDLGGQGVAVNPQDFGGFAPPAVHSCQDCLDVLSFEPGHGILQGQRLPAGGYGRPGHGGDVF